MPIYQVIDYAGKLLDAVGVAIIMLGTLAAFGLYILRYLSTAERPTAYQRARQQIGRAILLGLEFLIAGDIIRTVATTPTLQNLGVLALIVLIRTFLSIALQVEVDRRWPWQKEDAESRRAQPEVI